MKDEKRIYNIGNINEEQLSVIMKALDVYTRLGLLQLENAILDDLVYKPEYNYPLVRNEIEYHLNEIKKLIVACNKSKDIKKLSTSNTNWSFGIATDNVPLSCKRAYEIYKSISHKKWKDRKDRPSYSVDQDEGLKLTTDQRVNVESETERVIKIKDILSE